MSTLQELDAFIHTQDFWFYHGWILTTLWVFCSLFGMYIRKHNLKLHLLSFFIVDWSTVFWGGAALYRLWNKFNQFDEWVLSKRIHVVGGIILLTIMVIQHGGGMVIYYFKGKSKYHRLFGPYVTHIARFVTVFGWLYAGHPEKAIIVGIISIIVLLWLSWPTLKSKKS